jgi:AcrR family transcriptional regulator
MVVFAGQGDARRSMELLWRGERAAGARTGPGPKPALSVDLIVDTAIALADAEGMAALSMRAVGERLGRTAMALYTYVPSKAELVDLMHDRALAEMPSQYEREPGWRAAVTRWAEDAWRFYLRHPWVLQVSQARPVLGPNEYAAIETLVGILRGTGLPAGVLRRVIGTLSHVVRGSAQAVAEARQAAAVTGVSDEDWWYARSALIQEMAPDFGDRHPGLVWLETEGATPASAAGCDDVPEEEAHGGVSYDDGLSYMEREARLTFEAGLAVLLDGVEAATRRAADAPPAAGGNSGPR